MSEFLSTGIPEIDSITDGLPRGAITELTGLASSGKTSLLLHILSGATRSQELCALVDINDSFDVEAATQIGIDFDYLLWIRCCSNIDHGLKAAEFLLQSGGFGLVVLDLGDLSIDHPHNIPLSCWFRLRRAVENTRASLLIIEQEPRAKTCATLILETHGECVKWLAPDQPSTSAMFGGLKVHVERYKPISSKNREIHFETAF